MKTLNDYILIGIDPGPTKSALAVIERQDGEIKLLDFKYGDNQDIASEIKSWSANRLIIEQVSHYGRQVGQSTFDTCFSVGYFYAIAEASRHNVELLKKPEVGHILTGSRRATKAQVQQAVKERFKPTGGGSDPYKGIQSQQGPLYGTSNHILDAIGVALAWMEAQDEVENV